MSGITVLPTCKRCGGAFYPNPDFGRWDSYYCEDCWMIARDADAKRMRILEARWMVCPFPKLDEAEAA